MHSRTQQIDGRGFLIVVDRDAYSEHVPGLSGLMVVCIPE
jgi:hypothetical protein